MRRILNITNEEPTGSRSVSDKTIVINLRGDFDPCVLEDYGRHFDSVIFSVPTPDLTEEQLNAVDRVVRTGPAA